MTFIPQAIVHESQRIVLHVFRNETNFNEYWRGRVQTVDAPGIAVLPWQVKAGDTIDFFITGWTKTKVNAVDFVPDLNDTPVQRSGHYKFTTQDGYRNVQINGNQSWVSVYIFQ